jgi:hypothetical protein
VITLTFKRVSDGQSITVSAARETLQYTDSGMLLSFHAYVGPSDDYVPYVLTTDNSSSKKAAMRTGIDGAIAAWKTRSGYIAGANSGPALRKGPNAMRAAALAGVQRGFKYGLLWVAAKEVVTHVAHRILPKAPTHPKHYYVSTDGPDLVGPIYLDLGR